MTDPLPKRTWVGAIREAAGEQHIDLPPFTNRGMGSMLCQNPDGRRAVSLKRRLVPNDEAEKAGIEWTLWSDDDGHPVPVATFREAAVPTPERVASILPVLKGWLRDAWTAAQVIDAAKHHPNAKVLDAPLPQSEREEYWLSEDRAFGIVVEKDHWGIYSRATALSKWQSKDKDASGESLPILILDRFCEWLADGWFVIAYGSDSRPARLRARGVSASRVYETAQHFGEVQREPEIQTWWARHAIRAADEELPDVFFERQADDLVVSWDPAPAPSRFYRAPRGEEVVPVDFAVPVLRQLVRARLKVMNMPEAKRNQLLAATSSHAAAGYEALLHYNLDISPGWLTGHGFTSRDAQEFALAGTSRHPIVGLLRSSQGSAVSADDYEMILRMLKPSDKRSYVGLKEVARGNSIPIQAREPWESGYRLAGLVRQRLGKAPTDQFDVEREVQHLGIEVRDVPLSDAEIRGVSVGSPLYAPLVVINTACPDASGVSGRRTTLGHELCHLLFDRLHMRSLARFESPRADSDRLIEMRANAFAIELLVPMSILLTDQGTVVDNEELKRIAIERQVSLHALESHAENLRDRLRRQ